MAEVWWSWKEGAGVLSPLQCNFVHQLGLCMAVLMVLCHIKDHCFFFFFAHSFVNVLLFLVHHQVPASRMPPFRPDLRQIQTLHSIMTTGVHCILPQPGRQATEPRTEKSDGAKEFLLDRGKGAKMLSTVRHSGM